MKILFAASEVAPFSQTGGLGDVAGSLPKAIAAKGHTVSVVSPLYGTVSDYWRKQMTFVTSFTLRLSWRNQYCGILRLERDGVTYYFIDNEMYFKRSGPYGYDDDGERFAFFSKAIIVMQQQLEDFYDILHCNDWHTALAGIYLKTAFSGCPGFKKEKFVFTIHNIEYQGKFDPYILGDLFGLDIGVRPILEFDGCLNLMKGAIVCCDALTTVSPTYAQEIRLPANANGLHSIINGNAHKLRGIINGLDYTFYDPETDNALSNRFSANDMRGKRFAKAALQKQLGLVADPDAPIVAMVSRLVSHKGLSLVCEKFDELMSRGVQFVLLGSGDRCYQEFFEAARQRWQGKAAVWFGFNSDLARRIYAGSDIFLMPSAAEPCGLSQLIAMRYATVPVVHAVGGLHDTVTDARLGSGNGFRFDEYSGSAMMNALDAALGVYADKKSWNALRKYAASCDFSWNKPADEYTSLYFDVK